MDRRQAWRYVPDMFVLPQTQADYTIGTCSELSWRLTVWCSNRHVRSWSPLELDGFPARATLGALAERLVCSECGSREGTLALTQDPDVTMQRQVAEFEAREALKAERGLSALP